MRRDGTPDATVARAGVTAQKLRHLDVLLVRPWAVRLEPGGSVPVAAPADVMLASPVTFIAQKLLIQKYRAAGKQAQDALYIHDTIELFGGALPALARKTVLEVERLCQDRFGAVNDAIRTAARIPPDRSLTPDRVRALCAYGLEQIFGR